MPILPSGALVPQRRVVLRALGRFDGPLHVPRGAACARLAEPIACAAQLDHGRADLVNVALVSWPGRH